MEHRLIRQLKNPAVRKTEILHVAMELFCEYGYEETSMRDISRKLGISLGLCYRYFDSKQILFNEAMAQYVEDYCVNFLKIIHRSDVHYKDKLNMIYTSMKNESSSTYHDFFHRPENTLLHQQLTMKICDYISPHIEQELQVVCAQEHWQINNIHSLVRFLTYGQIALLSDPAMPDERILQDILRYIDILMHHEIIPN